MLRWLGAPFDWALSPLLDSAHAERLPFAPLRVVLGPIAAGAESAFGPPRMHRWPGAAFGTAGLGWLVFQTIRARQQLQGHGVRLFTLGLGWFGFGVAVLVVIARCGFFQGRPDQILAQRYLPWSMLMWTGLLLTHIHDCARTTRCKVAAVLLAATVFAPSQVWTGRYAFRRQTLAEQIAVATAVGVLNVDFRTGESKARELQRALPVLQAAHTSVWTWPAVQMLGQPAATPITAIDVINLTVVSIENLYPGEGCDVHFRAEADHELVLLVDEDGIVQGLAMPDVASGEWLGWLRGTATAAQVRVVAP